MERKLNNFINYPHTHTQLCKFKIKPTLEQEKIIRVNVGDHIIIREVNSFKKT